MNIYLILSSIFVGVTLFKLSFQNNYINNLNTKLKEKITQLMVTLCYNSLYLFSLCSIKFNTIHRQFMSYLHENKIYSINLKNNKYNYYIVNNCLNQLFLKYYLKNVLKTQINPDTFDYKLSIIDNNVNIMTLLPNQYIIIMEDDYQIHSVPNDTHSENNNVVINNSF